MRIFSKTKIQILLLITTAFLAIGSFSSSAMAGPFSIEDNSSVIYCKTGDCSLEKGADIVKKDINNIEKNKSFSAFIQDIVAYILAFLGIVGVLYLIYAGFRILTSGGNDDDMKKSKSIVKTVIIGLILIFLAFSIVKFVIGDKNGGGIFNEKSGSGTTGWTFPSFIEQTYAYTEYDINTFDDYKKKIELLSSTLDREYQVNNQISVKTLSSLESLVRSSMDTFSDNSDTVYNMNLANNLLTAIELVKKRADSDSAISGLAKGITEYLTKTKIRRVSGTITASPNTGNAPFIATLRATEVVDPSGVTIPKSGYIWWMRSTGGARTVLGTGPSISYTFPEERTYTVFLSIVSGSKNSKGKTDVLPFESSINIAVQPKIGSLYLSINGKYVSNEDKVKFNPSIARQGLLIDASASIPASGTKFVSTTWDYGNGNIARYSGAPSIDRQIYANEGTYKLRLEVMTNENKLIVKELMLEVHDPIAGIRADKTTGFPQEEFRFSTSTVASRDLGYSWQITNLDESNSLYTSTLQNITYKFKKAGKYAVKLRTLANNGKEDIDTVVITIDGREPVATFESKSQSPETPNTIVFDATRSYDPDNLDNGTLSYAWTIDGTKIDLSNPSRNGAIGRFTFDTLGTHKVSLEVSTKEGKSTTYTKDINIDTLLSVKLITSPKIIRSGNSVSMIADAPEAQTFEWQFGDGESDTTTSGRVAHIYKKTGTFNVSLTVRGRGQNDSNTISRKIYVMDSENPFAIVSLKRDNEEIIPTSDGCDGKEAFIIDRAKPISFNADDSVNIDGTTSGLSYTWKYANRNSSQKNFSYKFDELGCFPVTLTVRSEKTGAQHTSKTYVQVENLAPKLSSLTIAANNTDADPVTVTVTANNAVDEDGAIASYIWYYYTAEDPEPQDFRVTRSPKTVFVLPRIGAKYYFAVILEDSNGLKVNSDDMTTERYSLTLVSDNINTPIIGLKTSSNSVSVGQKVDFTVSAKNILGADLAGKAEYKWDYNGDGFYEETTNTPTVSHVYAAPGNFNFKVKVTYKGISNTKYQAITVKNELTPNLEYIAIGKKFIFLNTTKGLYTKVKWTIGDTTSANTDSFTYDFGDEAVSGNISLEVSDGTNTKSTEVSLKKDISNAMKLKKMSDKVAYFSYPASEDNTIHIANLGEKAFIYLGESKGNIAKYAIDTDTSVDSNLNGEKNDDIDNKGTESLTNGSAYAIKSADATSKEKTMRIHLYDATNTLIGSKDIKVVFDFITGDSSAESLSGSTNTLPKDISENDTVNLEKLKNLIKESGEKDRLKMMQYYGALQENWFDTREKTKTIIDFENYIDTNSSLDAKSKEAFYSLLEGFLVAETQVKDDIGLATSVLKSLIPKTNAKYAEIMKNIDEILSHPTNTALNKELGTFILNAIKDDSTIETKDKTIIKAQLQTIIYGGQNNVPKANVVPADTGSSSGILNFILGFGKILLYVLGGIVGIIILAFIGFKIGNRQENLGFQDFIIDKLTGKKAPAAAPKPPVREEPKTDILASIGTREETVVPVAKITPIVAAPEKYKEEIKKEDTGIPDWLKASSFSEEGVKKEEQEAVIPENNTQPEVIESKEIIEPTPEEKVLEEPKEDLPSNDLPDWLKNIEEPLIKEELPPEQDKEIPYTAPEETFPKEEELPAWMKNMDQQAIAEEVEQEIGKKEVVEANTDPSSSYEDLPDWLKTVSTPAVAPVETEEIQEEVKEEAAVVKEEKPKKKEAKEKTGVKKEEAAVTKEEKPKKKKPTPIVSDAPAIPTSTDEDLPDWLK